MSQSQHHNLDLTDHNYHTWADYADGRLHEQGVAGNIFCEQQPKREISAGKQGSRAWGVLLNAIGKTKITEGIIRDFRRSLPEGAFDHCPWALWRFIKKKANEKSLEAIEIERETVRTLESETPTQAATIISSAQNNLEAMGATAMTEEEMKIALCDSLTHHGGELQMTAQICRESPGISYEQALTKLKNAHKRLKMAAVDKRRKQNNEATNLKAQ